MKNSQRRAMFAKLNSPVDYFNVIQAEGRTDDPRLGHPFKFIKVADAERHLLGSDMPKRGYNKHDVLVQPAKVRLRYDRGKSDASFTEQVKPWLRDEDE